MSWTHRGQDLKVICSHIVTGVLETLSQKIGRPQAEITADQFGYSAHGQAGEDFRLWSGPCVELEMMVASTGPGGSRSGKGVELS